MFEWYHIFHQNIKQQNIFNIDNEKCFLSSKSAYYNDFCDTETYFFKQQIYKCF